VAPLFIAGHRVWNEKLGKSEIKQGKNWAQSLALFEHYLKTKLESIAYGLRDAEKEAKNNFDITRRRLVKLTSKDYYYYAIGFLFSSFINTFCDLHDRDMTLDEQDEVVRIVKERVKESIDKT
jgi:hypothetical protein